MNTRTTAAKVKKQLRESNIEFSSVESMGGSAYAIFAENQIKLRFSLKKAGYERTETGATWTQIRVY